MSLKKDIVVILLLTFNTINIAFVLYLAFLIAVDIMGDYVFIYLTTGIVMAFIGIVSMSYLQKLRSD